MSVLSWLKDKALWILGALLTIATIGGWYYRRRALTAERQRDEARAKARRVAEVADSALQHAAEVRETERKAAIKRAELAADAARRRAAVEAATTDEELAEAIKDWSLRREP